MNNFGNADRQEPAFEDRRAQLQHGLHEVEQRIAAACDRHGRDMSEVGLVAVVKTFPASDVALLSDLGVRDVGENRVPEAVDKVAGLARLRPDTDLRWHMVGTVQRNKTRSVARWASVVQSVDSSRLIAALDRAVAAARGAGERAGPLRALLQVSLDDDPARGGCSRAEAPALADELAGAEHLEFAGVMAVAPLRGDPDHAFAALSSTATRLRRDHPSATELSAGMSDDLEVAVKHGSTCVRVGTALLGPRPLASR